MLAQGLVAALASAALATESAVVVQPPAGPPAVVQPPVAQSPTAGPSPPTAKAGTAVELELEETVSTQFVKRGDTFVFRLARPLMVDGHVIVPAGVSGVGEVVDAGRPGLGGKPGKLVLAARRLNVGDQHPQLRSFFLAGSGDDKTDTVVAASLAVGFAAYLIKGGNVVLPAGTRARAKLAQDFTPAANITAPPINPSAP